jgi:hypothetical protein
METAKKKPGLALVVSVGKGKPEPKKSEASDEYSAAVDELAEVIGVADDKMADFKAAFEAAVMACK